MIRNCTAMIQNWWARMQNRLARMPERSWMVHEWLGVIQERLGMIRNWLGMIPEGLPMIQDCFDPKSIRDDPGTVLEVPNGCGHARDPREPPREHENLFRSLSTSIPAPDAAVDWSRATGAAKRRGAVTTIAAERRHLRSPTASALGKRPHKRRSRGAATSRAVREMIEP